MISQQTCQAAATCVHCCVTPAACRVLLLPAQTSMLVNALSETSIHQSAHYSHSTKGRHVVVTGHLTATAASTIVDELFHPDSGFADYNIVFLNPNPPSDAMKKLLKTSQHAHRVLYLQGSWASQQVRCHSKGGTLTAAPEILYSLQGDAAATSPSTDPGSSESLEADALTSCVE